jgi:dsRNA-specific ribonuclease
MYNDMNEKLTFYNGIRDASFKSLLWNILKKGKLKEHYINCLLTPEALVEYDKAFTSSTISSHVDPTTGKIEVNKIISNNYETYEKLGDGIFDNFIGWYAFRRFGEVNNLEQVKLLHIIRSKYGSKKEFAPLSEKLGFWPYISSSVYARNHEKKKLLEDVFEAFLGVTSFILDKNFRNGVGYAICYDILSSIFDDIKFSTDFSEMVDYVTKLKQVFDKIKNVKIEYQDRKIGDQIHIMIYQKSLSGEYKNIGTGVSTNKKDAKQNAAENALKNLGYLKK